MSRAPRLRAPLRNGIALRQVFYLLIDIPHVKVLLRAAADDGLEVRLYLMLYNKRDPAKTGAVGVEKGKIYDRVAVLVNGGYLLEAAEAAAHARGKYYESRFLHGNSPHFSLSGGIRCFS